MKFTRITFGGNKVDYKANFTQCREFYPVIQSIFATCRAHARIEYWWFFEPHVEITIVDEEYKDFSDESFLEDLREDFVKYGITDYNISHSEIGGWQPDWYCNSRQEMEFGWRTYAESRHIAQLFYEYKEEIDKGKGLEAQYVRRCHVLANQLALDYKKEGIYLWKRGLLCLLFWYLGHHKAVWIYTKIFRFKY